MFQLTGEDGLRTEPLVFLAGSGVLKRPTVKPDAVPSQRYPQPQRAVELSQAEALVMVCISKSGTRMRALVKTAFAKTNPIAGGASKRKSSSIFSSAARFISFLQNKFTKQSQSLRNCGRNAY